MHEQAERAEKAETIARPRRLVRRIVIGAVLAALFAVALLAVWQTGLFDGVLYRVRLNAHDCFLEGSKAEGGSGAAAECGSNAATECEKEAQFEAKFKHRYENTENVCYSGILGR